MDSATSEGKTAKGFDLKKFINRWGILLVLLGMSLLLAVLTFDRGVSIFLRYRNIVNILRQSSVIGIIGARNREMVILEDEMRQCSDELHITTDDGSYGLKGFVTDALDRVIHENKSIQSVYTTGPLPMMKAVAELTRKYELHTMASLNPIMMDGTGMCGACRVSVGGEMKFTCVDGPEFDAHKVNFDELILRNKTYFDQERKAMDSFKESCKVRGAYV